MPIYEFECKTCGRLEEAQFTFSDKHELLCDHCKTPMQKIIRAVGVIFNAPGFYKTGG